MKFCLASGEWDIPEFNDEGGAGLVSTWTTRPLYIDSKKLTKFR